MSEKLDLHQVDNRAGWRLSLKRVAARPQAHGRPARPALIIPGYGMNSFIFGFHPRGLSMEEYLASRGIEVWSVDLREQGRSTRTGGSERYTLAELADDVAAAVDYVLANTQTGARQIDLIGCSLGTALMFGYLALYSDAKDKVRCLVNVGGLVTWKKIHPALRAVFFSPRLVGAIRVRQTRRMAGLALPFITRFAPWAIAAYTHHRSTDLSQAAVMVQTVEDPNPHVNRDIAEWIGRRDLVLRGVNVSRSLESVNKPFLCIVANNDGIVPPATARAPFDAIGSSDKELLEVGDPTFPIAHADLFLSTGCQETVFDKLATFLGSR
jgi:pimeloyl-ACP methyl ester carboxylesterase